MHPILSSFSHSFTLAVTVSTNTGDFAIYRNGVKVETTALEGGVSVTVPNASYNTIGMAGYNNEILNGFTMNKYMIFDMDLSAVEVNEVYEGKFSDMAGGQEPEPEFVAVSDITGVPTAAKVGQPLTLSATVEPANATNQTIV